VPTAVGVTGPGSSLRIPAIATAIRIAFAIRLTGRTTDVRRLAAMGCLRSGRRHLLLQRFHLTFQRPRPDSQRVHLRFQRSHVRGAGVGRGDAFEL
jgi:hypothetical protein